MIETGTILQQRYKIDKQIGQGGMGAVYVATDERFGSTVAIKETLCMDDSFRKAIEREARLLNSLKHSALPRVSDHFEENNGVFLVMEYIPGDDLAAMLENEKVSFSVDKILKWADELLDALDYLHSQELPVIHRDIKPQNLKINSRGEMILLDFGLAKGNPTDASHQTAAKSIFGYSRNYASLEQIQGTGTDPRSDLYSLAATLYHLLTRNAPDDALTRAMSVLSQKPDPLIPVSVVNPMVSSGVAGVLRNAMDLNASERPASASEMRKMLRESEKYKHLANLTTVANVADPQIFAQQTKLMPEETRPVVLSDTSAKTEILPGPDSHETAVRSTRFDPKSGVAPAYLAAGTSQKSRVLGILAGALMMLFVCVLFAGGLYLFKPSVFGIDTKTGETGNSANVTSEATNATADKAKPVTTTSESRPETAAGQVSVPQINAEVTRPAESDKPVETTKNTKSTSKPLPKTTKVDEGDSLDFEVDEPGIPPGGIVLSEKDESGKVTTMRINPMGSDFNMQRRPKNGADRFPFGINPKDMTPAQRQKMQKMLRNNPQMRPPPPARPNN